MADNKQAVIISAARTPTGKFQGLLKGFTAPDLAAIAIKEAVSRAGVAPEKVDEVIMGCVVQAGIGQAPARAGTIEVARRDTLTKESQPLDGVVEHVRALLDDIQANIYKRALAFREENTFTVDTWDEFKEQIEKGGFIMAHWDGTPETEEAIKTETKATIRCIPLVGIAEAGKCVYSGNESMRRVVFARAY